MKLMLREMKLKLLKCTIISITYWTTESWWPVTNINEHADSLHKHTQDMNIHAIHIILMHTSIQRCQHLWKKDHIHVWN